MIDLHGQIMNLPASKEPAGGSMAYKLGHRDARHAAAELALKADALLAAIKDAADDAADRGDVFGQRIARLLVSG